MMSSGIAEAPEPGTGTTFTEANLKEQVLLVVSKFSNPPAKKNSSVGAASHSATGRLRRAVRRLNNDWLLWPLS
jgi:hypothetical protein